MVCGREGEQENRWVMVDECGQDVRGIHRRLFFAEGPDGLFCLALSKEKVLVVSGRFSFV